MFPDLFVMFSHYGEIFPVHLWVLMRSLYYVTHNCYFRDEQLYVCWPKLVIDNFDFGLMRVGIVMARSGTARKWDSPHYLQSRFWIQYVDGIPYIVWDMVNADNRRSRHSALGTLFSLANSQSLSLPMKLLPLTRKYLTVFTTARCWISSWSSWVQISAAWTLFLTFF